MTCFRSINIRLCIRQVVPKRFAQAVVILVLILSVRFTSFLLSSTTIKDYRLGTMPKNISQFVNQLFRENGINNELLKQVKAHQSDCACADPGHTTIDLSPTHALNHVDSSSLQSPHSELQSPDSERAARIQERFRVLHIQEHFPNIDRRIITAPNLTIQNTDRHISPLISKFHCHTGPIKVLVIMFSRAANFEIRQTVRNTWGNHKFTYSSDEWRVFFTVGQVKDEKVMSMLKKESDLYHDIIKGKHFETSESNSVELEIMLEWSYRYCNFQYLLKVDERNFVNTRNLFQLLKSYESNPKGVYLGRVHTSARPVRDPGSTYYVSKKEYSGSRFPPFATSLGFLLSRDVVGAMVSHFLPTPFKLNDVYAGILTLNAEADAVHSPLFLHDPGECMTYYDDPVVVHFERKNKRPDVMCLKQNFYEMLARQAQDNFVYHNYKKNKTFLDSARAHGHKAKSFGGHVDYRLFTRPKYENLQHGHHISQLISKFRCHTRPIKVLVMLLSYTANFKTRQAVRHTWGNSKFTYANDDWRIFFTVARVKDEKVMLKLKEESDLYQDIVMGNHYESFYNNSWKLEMMFEWSYRYCDFEYLLKVDDDNFISMKNLFNLLDSYKATPTKIYLGRLFWKAEVYRGGKYSVTYEEYATETYQPFVTGGAVLMSYDVVRDIIPYFQPHPFKLEDVYVGMLVANINVTGTHSLLFQHYEFGRWCEYKDKAIALHFNAHKQVDKIGCLKELMRGMLRSNRRDAFVELHYSKHLRGHPSRTSG